MIFSEIYHHKDLKQQLIGVINSGKISHAQLFHAVDGGVGLSLALAYIQYLYCEQKSNNDACGVCPSCLKNTKLSHPDVHYIFPHPLTISESKKATIDEVLPQWKEMVIEQQGVTSYSTWLEKLNAENKQAVIGVEDSESILSKLSLKSYEGNYKTLLLWLPEYMNEAASNKLLKLVEEPPAKTLFILVSANPEAVISTILSRTQRVFVPNYSGSELSQLLVDKLGVSENEALSASNISEGNLEYALNLASGNDENKYFSIYKEWMRLCYKKDISSIIDWVDEVASLGREQQKGFVKYALYFVRNAIMSNYIGNQLVYLTPDESAFNEKFSPFIHHNNIEGLFKELNEAHYNLSRNANPKPLFLDLSIKINYLIHNKN